MPTTTLLTELNQLLAALKIKLGEHGERVCAEALQAIKTKLAHLEAVSRASMEGQTKQEIVLLTELVATIEALIKEIDVEVSVLEKSMPHGESHPDAPHKKTFRSALQELIDRIRIDLPYI